MYSRKIITFCMFMYGSQQWNLDDETVIYSLAKMCQTNIYNCGRDVKYWHNARNAHSSIFLIKQTLHSIKIEILDIYFDPPWSLSRVKMKFTIVTKYSHTILLHQGFKHIYI